MLSLSFYSTARTLWGGHQELRRALLLVWAAITLATAGAVAAPFVLPDRAIARVVPVCESKRLYGRECILCGATTGFIAIGHGDWKTAGESNRLAIPLFLAFCVNAAAAGTYFSVKAFHS